MKRKTYKRFFSFLLGSILFMNVSVTAMATEIAQEHLEETVVEEEIEETTVEEESIEEEPIIEAREILNDKEAACQSLEVLVSEREISALLYLKDIYTIKAAPDPRSEYVVSIASGQEVLITGVDADKGGNIWYQVIYRYDEGEYQGYIERTYLAFSDERLREWEAENISSRVRMFAMRRAVNYADVEQFPESYRDALYKLKQSHPNWTFVKMETGLNWNDVIKAQAEADRNLIYANTSKDSWMEGMYDSTWAYASDGIIKYFVDPRNALTENLVFQFEQLTYNKSYHSATSTQKVLEGTFMDGAIPGTDTTYVKAFMSIASDKNVSPLLIASRIRQEQGVAGTSALISGTYPGYENLYNYYNIGASGNTMEKVIVSGLKKAREMKWTTRLLSLSGGADFITHSYVKRGQDTLYLQKFDVDNSYDGVYWHQYMQNVQAPHSEAKSTYKAYSSSGIVDSPFVFKIPVYKNMPAYACVQPGSEDKITLNTTNVSNLPVGQTAVLTSYINGVQNTSVAMAFTSSDTKIATVDEKGVVTGVAPGKVTITCKKAENPDSATTATCSVTIVKADISISDIKYPKVEVTYSPTQTLASIPLPKGFAWVDGTIIPIVVNGGYSVTYNPDNSKYNTLTLSIPVTVKKAVVDKASLSLPTNLQAVAGYELKSVSLPAGYAWTDSSQVVPKKVGTYQYTASYCMDEVNYEVVDDITLSVKVVCKTHEFGKWSGKNADCTNAGKLTRSCSICGKSETVTKDALGHDYQSKVTKEPTVSATGIRTYTCTRCNNVYEEEIPKKEAPHEHKYKEEITKEAGCETTGIKTFTCSCGDTYTDTIEALGHALTDGVCSKCGYTIPTLPQHTHSYTFSGSTENCTKDGVATYVCGCGESYTEDTKALGHDIVKGKCTRCDYKETTGDASDTGSGNAGNTGNSDNGGSTGNTGNSGNGGSTGSTGNSGNGGNATTGNSGSTNTGGNGSTGTTGNSGNGGSTGNSGSTNTGGNGSTGTTGNSGNGGNATTGNSGSTNTGGNGSTGSTGNSGNGGSTGNSGSTNTGGNGSTGSTGNSGNGGNATTGNSGSTNTGGSGSAGNTGSTGDANTGNSGNTNTGTSGSTGNAGNGNSGSAGSTGDANTGNNGNTNTGTSGNTGNAGNFDNAGNGNSGSAGSTGDANTGNNGNTNAGTSGSTGNSDNAGNNGSMNNSTSGSTENSGNANTGNNGSTNNGGSGNTNNAGNANNDSSNAGEENNATGNTNTTGNVSSPDKPSDSKVESNKESAGNGFFAAIQNALTGTQDSEENDLTSNITDVQNQNEVQQQTQGTVSQPSNTLQKPGNTSPPQNNKIEEEKETPISEGEAIKITMKHSTMLDKEKLAILTESQRNLELVMNDNVVWNVDLSAVKDVQKLSVDMGVTLNNAEIPKEVLAKLPSEYPCILMSLAHNGEFGFDAVLTVPLNKVNKGKFANLFYYNPGTEDMEFITDSIIAEDGTAVFDMEHASDYAIILAERSLNPNPVEEVMDVEVETENTNVETKNSNVALIMILVVIGIAVLVAGVFAGMKFFKKKAEDNYYFDEEDEIE